MSWNGTVRCGHCYESGHNKRSCPQLTETLKRRALEEQAQGEGLDGYWGRRYTKRTGLYADGTAAPKTAKAKQVRRCKYCNKKGHNRRTCPELKEHIATAAVECVEYRTALLARMQELGMGIGALLSTERYGETIGYMVQGIGWEGINHLNGPSGGQSVRAEVLRTEGVSQWQRTQHFGVPALEGAESHYRYQVVGPVSGSSVAAGVPADWLEAENAQTWAKEYFKERQSPNFYDNYEY